MVAKVAGQFQKRGDTDGFIGTGGPAGHSGRAVIKRFHDQKLLAQGVICAGNQAEDVFRQDILPGDS